MNYKKLRFFLLMVCLCLRSVISLAEEVPKLNNIEIIPGKGKTQIIFHLTKSANYYISQLDSPPRLLLDFKIDVESKLKEKFQVGKGNVELIRSYYLAKDTSEKDVLLPLDAVVVEFTQMDSFVDRVDGNNIILEIFFQEGSASLEEEVKEGAVEDLESAKLAGDVSEKKSKEQVNKLMEQGQAYYRDNNFARAVESWEEALKYDPTNSKIQAYLRRAKGKLTKEELEKEPLEKQDELATIDDQVESYLRKGKGLYRKKKYTEAIGAWKTVLKLDPKNPQAVRYIEKAKEKLEASKDNTIKFKEVNRVSPEEETHVEMPDELPDILKDQFDEERKNYNDLDLKQCLSIAFQNNTELKIAQEEVVLAYLKSEDARQVLQPKGNLKWSETAGSTSGSKYRGRELTFELQQPLYDGNKSQNQYRQAKVNIVVSEKNYEKQKNDFEFEIEQAYYVLANSQKILDNLKKGLSVAEETLDLLKQRVEMDLSNPVDLLNVKSSYNDMYLKVASALNDLKLAKLSLKQKIGISPNTEISVISTPSIEKMLDISFEECLDLAYENRSDVEVNELMVLYHMYAVKMAKGATNYKVDLNATAGFNDEAYLTDPLRLEGEWYLGVKLSKVLGVNVLENNMVAQDKVPAAGQTTSSRFTNNVVTLKMFQNNANTPIAEATVAYHKAIQDYEKARNTVFYEIQEGMFNYKKSILKIDNALSTIALTKKEIEINQMRSELEEVAPHDFLKIKLKLHDTLNDYEQAVTDYYTQIAKINKLIGINNYFDPVHAKKNISWAEKRKLPRSDIIPMRWWQVWKKQEDDEISDIIDEYYELDEEFEKFYPIDEKRPQNRYWQFWKKSKSWEKDIFPLKTEKEEQEAKRNEKLKGQKEEFKNYYIERIKEHRLLPEEIKTLEDTKRKTTKKQWWKFWNEQDAPQETFLEESDFYPVEADSRILLPKEKRAGKKWWKFWDKDEDLNLYMPEETKEEIVLPEEDDDNYRLQEEVLELTRLLDAKKNKPWVKILNYKIEVNEGDVRVIFNTTEKVYFKAYELKNPTRLIISFDESIETKLADNIAIENRDIKSLRFRRLGTSKAVTAVVFDLAYPLAYKVYSDNKRIMVVFKNDSSVLE